MHNKYRQTNTLSPSFRLSLRWCLSAYLALLVLIACGQPSAESVPSTVRAPIATDGKLLDSSATRLTIGSVAPDFQYTLPNRQIQRLSDLRGKRVIVNFWATYCEPCREEMADLEAASVRYPDVAVIGINRRESLQQIEAYSHDVAVSFPLVENQQGDIEQQYQLRGIPVSYFINADGTISGIRIGALDAAQIDAYLEATR